MLPQPRPLLCFLVISEQMGPLVVHRVQECPQKSEPELSFPQLGCAEQFSLCMDHGAVRHGSTGKRNLLCLRELVSAERLRSTIARVGFWQNGFVGEFFEPADFVA